MQEFIKISHLTNDPTERDRSFVILRSNSVKFMRDLV